MDSADSTSAESPLFIRWGSDRSLYALEFRFDLVGRIREWVARKEHEGVEVGGVLIGSLPNSYSATLRIEDIEFIDRDASDGLTFMLNPSQLDRFAEVRWRTRDPKTVALGMFRTHLRPGAMRPSLADRTLLSNEFSGPLYVLMLVGGKSGQLRSNFFIAAHGQLPVDPSIAEFEFDESKLRALPEVEVPPPRAAAVSPVPSQGRRWEAPAAITGGILAAGVLMIAMLRGNLPVDALLASVGSNHRAVHLTARQEDDQLRISWDRTSLDAQLASSGLLRIRTKKVEQQVILGADDLRLGSVVVVERPVGTELNLSLQAAGRTIAAETLVVP